MQEKKTIKITEAMSYATCNVCASNHRVKHIEFWGPVNHGISVCLCKDCAIKLTDTILHSDWLNNMFDVTDEVSA